MFKNIILAYIPSLIISAFLFLILSLTQTINEQNCWNTIANKEALDYVIYGICFILPNLVSCIIILVYLWLYFKLPETKWTIYLLFPLIAIFFSLYYVILKSYVFFWEKERQTDLEIPLIMEPFLYGALFVYIYCRQQKKDMTDSDITIPDSDVTVSFIDQMWANTVYVYLFFCVLYVLYEGLLWNWSDNSQQGGALLYHCSDEE